MFMCYLSLENFVQIICSNQNSCNSRPIWENKLMDTGKYRTIFFTYIFLGLWTCAKFVWEWQWKKSYCILNRKSLYWSILLKYNDFQIQKDKCYEFFSYVDPRIHKYNICTFAYIKYYVVLSLVQLCIGGE